MSFKGSLLNERLQNTKQRKKDKIYLGSHVGYMLFPKVPKFWKFTTDFQH